MDERGYPSVYVVDTHAPRPPPVPPRLSQKRQSCGAVQILLFLLVTLALCGMLIEAFLIYRLHKTESEDASGSHAKQSGDPSSKGSREVLPSKPVAHLTGGPDAGHRNQVMGWSVNANPIMYNIEYSERDRSLIIQTEGFYNIYSKVSFLDINPFFHAIHVRTKRYKGKSIPLLVSRTNTPISCRKEIGDQKSSSGEASGREDLDQRSNSYLSGVFHFYKDDAIFVKVSNTSQIVRFRSYENVFGAYML
ncbi:tumor necrosis factor ligand superfamily member 14 [Halichoeres trimaculatus]|uniref:tumor necrosis factor ligand superfamily member 14 n=1 Tax=Halichoeres trimaculatus TaxID=147232 RepID=UPI003D9E2246